jgi:hypothetical protein
MVDLQRFAPRDMDGNPSLVWGDQGASAFLYCRVPRSDSFLPGANQPINAMATSTP